VGDEAASILASELPIAVIIAAIMDGDTLLRTGVTMDGDTIPLTVGIMDGDIMAAMDTQDITGGEAVSISGFDPIDLKR